MHAFHSFGFALLPSPIALRWWWFARCQKYRLACSLYSVVKLKLPLLLAPHASWLLDLGDYESTFVSYIGGRCFLSSFPAPLLSYLLVWQCVQSFSLSLLLCLLLSLCISITVCVSVRLSVCQPVCLSLCLCSSVCLRLSLSVCLCLSVSACLSTCGPVCLSVCPSSPPPPSPPSLSLSQGGDDARRHENSCLPKGFLVAIELYPQSGCFWPSFIP